MKRIYISLDYQYFQTKPTNMQAAIISNRIGKQVKELERMDDLEKVILDIGSKGCTFSPATFTNGTRRSENFEQMQILVLDFDGGISYEEVTRRARKYQLPVLAVYETFSSNNKDRFRVLFLNNAPITDIISAKIIKDALMIIFPESDKTDSDVVKMYYGGKKVLYFNQMIETMDMEKVLRNMNQCLKDRHGSTHYKQYIRKIADNNGIRLNKNGFFDIHEIGEVIEVTDIGKISPSTIIYSNSNGDFLPLNYYQLNLTEPGTYTYSLDQKQNKNHKAYRADVIKYISDQCRLFHEFEVGARKLHHNELFGIANNLLNVETGARNFKKILEEHSNYYSESDIDKWDSHFKFGKEHNYLPMNCSKYCPYSSKCNHGKTMLSTVKVKRGTMVRLDNYIEEYAPLEEVQHDLEMKLKKAIEAADKLWHIIKAQTSIGKTETYLRLVKLSDKKFLIAVPTNKLKQDIKQRAKEMGIDIMITPSLDEIKDEIPRDIWEQIEFLRRTGQHSRLHSYIKKIALEENVICLKKYLQKLDEFEKHTGNVITTHRKLLTMSEKALNKYDVIIVDEDIISSSVITNQCEISVSTLKVILRKVTKEIEKGSGRVAYRKIASKIRKILNASKKYTQIQVLGFEWECDEDNEDGISDLADIPSFCLTERFIYRRASEDEKLQEDSIVFLKPFNFKKKKHIMVSATVDKDICEYCLGKKGVKFYECKQAKYAGVLKQFCEKSMSRQSIGEDSNIFRKVKRWSGFKNMITFKIFSKGDDMYFGNAIGCDYLKGQNINIVGTPYQVDFVYKLFAFSLGLSVDENAKMSRHLVTHNGYQFWFTTYGEEDNILRNIHFWLIESELEQAVGRARLLRFNCTVNLFSNFPIRQAEVIECSIDEMLKDYQ